MKITVAILVVSVVLLITVPGRGVEAASSEGIRKTVSGNPLLSVGSAGPDATKVQVSAEVQPERPGSPARPVTIKLSADRDCHAIMFGVTARGDVTILFPNREQPDSFIKAGGKLTLFGPDSRLKLVMPKDGQGMQLVLYVSSQPIDLSPLAFSGERAVIAIPADSMQEQKILREKIEQIAARKGFNRELVNVAEVELDAAPLKLMGVPPAPGAPAKEPSSETPGAVTGTRGRTDQLKEVAK